MAKRTPPRNERPEGRPRQDAPAPLPTWRNTRPRGNPDTHRKDLERSRERFEELLGR